MKIAAVAGAALLAAPVVLATFFFGRQAGVRSATRRRAAKRSKPPATGDSAQSQRIALLYDIACGHGRSYERHMENALQFALHELGYDCGGVTEIVNDTVTVLCTVGPSDGMPAGTKILLENSLTGFVVRCGDARELNDLQHSPWRDYPAVVSLGLASVVIVPITVASALYGTFYLGSRSVRTSALGEADKDFVRLVAALLGSMIERRRQEQKLDSLAFFDILTGLPNRTSIVEKLEHSITEAGLLGASFSVLYLDLDRFKEINDRAGHAIGDRILRACAERMQRCIGPSDAVGRFGGDEFVVIGAAGSGPQEAAALADCLADALAEPFLVDDVPYDLGLSVGIGVYPADGRSPAALLESADAAMYGAKRTKRAASTLNIAVRE